MLLTFKALARTRPEGPPPMIAILQGDERLDVRVEDELGRRDFTADLIRTAIACLKWLSMDTILECLVCRKEVAEQRKEKAAFIYRFAQHERGRENFRSDEISTNHATSRVHDRQAISRTEFGHTDSQSQRRPKGRRRTNRTNLISSWRFLGFLDPRERRLMFSLKEVEELKRCYRTIGRKEMNIWKCLKEELGMQRNSLKTMTWERKVGNLEDARLTVLFGIEERQLWESDRQ